MTEDTSSTITEWRHERVHLGIKIAIAVTISVVLWVTLIMPGIEASARKPRLPFHPNGLVGLGMSVLPGTAELTLEVDGQSAQSASKPKLRVLVVVNEEEELKAPVTLLVGGDLAGDMGLAV